MKLFRKKRRHHTVPESRDHPTCAYVRRLKPKAYNGVPLPEKVGTFDRLQVEAAAKESARPSSWMSQTHDVRIGHAEAPALRSQGR